MFKWQNGKTALRVAGEVSRDGDLLLVKYLRYVGSDLESKDNVSLFLGTCTSFHWAFVHLSNLICSCC